MAASQVGKRPRSRSSSFGSSSSSHAAISSDSARTSRPSIVGNHATTAGHTFGALRSAPRTRYSAESTQTPAPSDGGLLGTSDMEAPVESLRSSARPRPDSSTSSRGARAHTSSAGKVGFGAKMLAKMGYKQGEGLGKASSGITVPIQAHVRGNTSAGLGTRSASPATNSIRHTSPNRLSSRTDRLDDGLSARTISELLRAASALEPPRALVRLLGIRQDREVSHSRGDLATRLTALDAASLSARAGVEAMMTRWQALTISSHHIDDELNDLQGAARICHVCETELSSHLGALRSEAATHIGEALSEISPIVNRVRDVAVCCDAVDLATIGRDVWLAFLQPYLERELARWDIDQQAEWTPGILIALPPAARAPLSKLLRRLWLPKVQKFFDRLWDGTLGQLALLVFRAWQPQLDESLRTSFLSDIVEHNLLRFVERGPLRLGDGHEDPAEASRWLPDWLEISGRRSGTFVKVLARRVRTALSCWNVLRPPSAALSSILRVVDSRAQTSWVLEPLLPRLGDSFRGLHLGHGPESIHQWSWIVTCWTPIIGAGRMDHLIAREFLPTWLRYLRGRLDRDQDYATMGLWYETWEAALSSGLRNGTVLRENLALALGMMEDALSGRPMRPIPEGNAYEGHDPKRKASYEPVAAQPSAREMLRVWCMEHGCTIAIVKDATSSEGLPVYRVAGSKPPRSGVTDSVLVACRGELMWHVAKDRAFGSTDKEFLSLDQLGDMLT